MDENKTGQKCNRYAALTNWRISPASPISKDLPKISKYVIQIRFPAFFTNFESALIFANSSIETLHFHKREQSLKNVMSIIDIDREEFVSNLPYFSLGILRKSINHTAYTLVGKENTVIYFLKNSHPIESDLSLKEYAELLSDGCCFEKLVASADRAY